MEKRKKIVKYIIFKCFSKNYERKEKNKDLKLFSSV